MTPLPMTPPLMLALVGLSFFSGAAAMLVLWRLVHREPVAAVEVLRAATAVLFTFAVHADRAWTGRTVALLAVLLLLSLVDRRVARA